MTKWLKSFLNDPDIFNRKVATHDDEIQRLYEEMEQQIKNEKDRILLEVKLLLKLVILTNPKPWVYSVLTLTSNCAL